MVEVARGLIALGVRVDVVAGVDVDARPLELALEQHDGNALWVLCRSEMLDDFQLELLALTVRATEVASAQVLALPFDPDAIGTFVSLVQRRLASLGWIHSTAGPTAGVPTPGVPTPAGPDPTPLPRLAPDDPSSASISAGERRPSGARRTIGALALAVCTGLGAWALAGRDGSSAAVVSISPRGRAEVPQAVTGDPRPSPAPAASVVAAPPPEPMRPADAFAAALEDRSIRALDELLVTTPGDDTVTARAARTRCRALRVAGIDAWQLPDARQLTALADAGLIARDEAHWAKRGRSVRRARWSGTRMRTQGAGLRAEASAVCVALADR